MHKHFADWYREVEFGVTGEQVKAHASVIDEMAKKADASAVVAATLLLFGKGSPEYEGVLSQAMHEADALFPMKNNGRCLSVLAGVLLAEVWKTRADNVATIGALAVTCRAFAETSSVPPSADIILEAKEYLAARSSKNRDSIGLGASKPMAKDIQATLSQHLEKSKTGEPTTEQIISPLISATSSVASGLDDARTTIDVLKEELDVLWWVFSEFSLTRQQPFASLSPGVAGITAGLELAHCIILPPGPSSVRSLLGRVLRSGRAENPSVALSEAIAEFPVDWRKNTSQKDTVTKAGMTCPVHLAMKASLLADKREEWLPVFKKMAMTSNDPQAVIVDLAQQSCREAMLLRLLA